jgi:hypothetical protein
MSRHSRGMAAAALIALSSGLVLGGAGCVAGVRVYDPGYSDYHYWNRGEEAQFRIYLEGRREPYRNFRSLDQDQQREYWKWRHEHDHERSDADRH